MPRQSQKHGGPTSHIPYDIDPEHEWDHQPGEPSLWYLRFVQYRDMAKRPGDKRSVHATARFFLEQKQREAWAKKTKKTKEFKFIFPNDWNLKAREWRWKERAAAFDQWRVDEKQRKLEREREDDRDERIQIARALRGLASSALPHIQKTVHQFRIGDILALYGYANAELRTELYDTPHDRAQRAWEKSQRGDQFQMPTIREIQINLTQTGPTLEELLAQDDDESPPES